METVFIPGHLWHLCCVPYLDPHSCPWRSTLRISGLMLLAHHCQVSLHPISHGWRCPPVVSIRKTHRHHISWVLDRSFLLILALPFGQVQDSWGNTFFPWRFCDWTFLEWTCLLLGPQRLPVLWEDQCLHWTWLGVDHSTSSFLVHIALFQSVGSNCILFRESSLKSYL